MLKLDSREMIQGSSQYLESVLGGPNTKDRCILGYMGETPIHGNFF